MAGRWGYQRPHNGFDKSLWRRIHRISESNYEYTSEISPRLRTDVAITTHLTFGTAVLSLRAAYIRFHLERVMCVQ